MEVEVEVDRPYVHQHQCIDEQYHMMIQIPVTLRICKHDLACSHSNHFTNKQQTHQDDYTKKFNT